MMGAVVGPTQLEVSESAVLPSLQSLELQSVSRPVFSLDDLNGAGDFRLLSSEVAAFPHCRRKNSTPPGRILNDNLVSR